MDDVMKLDRDITAGAPELVAIQSGAYPLIRK